MEMSISSSRSQPPRLQRSGHAAKYSFPFRDVGEDQTGMHKIERGLWQGISRCCGAAPRY